MDKDSALLLNAGAHYIKVLSFQTLWCLLKRKHNCEDPFSIGNEWTETDGLPVQVLGYVNSTKLVLQLLKSGEASPFLYTSAGHLPLSEQ